MANRYLYTDFYSETSDFSSASSVGIFYSLFSVDYLVAY